MTRVFLLQNQDKLLLNKQGEWVDGRDAAALFRAAHRDEALNQMVEVNSRDYTLRINLLDCELSQRGAPRIEEKDLPPLSLYQSDAAEHGDSSEESTGVEAAQSAARSPQGEAATIESG